MEYKLILKIVGATVFIAVIVIIFSLTELYTQLSRYKSYWNNRNQQASQPGEILYVALGDSTAQGIGAGSADKGYVGIIAKDIESKTDAPVRTINLSKSGAKIKDALERQLPALQQLPVNEKTIITIEIGANDIISFNAATFESEMDQVMKQLPPQTIISDMPYFGQSRFSGHEKYVTTANEIMYRLAKKHDFELVPLHERMKAKGGLNSFAADWFHPSNHAYRNLWAAAFLSRINGSL